MFLSNIKLKNFRGYSEFSHTFSKNVLFLVGPNGAGKTNFLESLRVLSLSKSFRARRDVELIQFDKDFARVEGEVKLAQREVKLAVTIERAGRAARKTIQINKKPAPALNLVGKMTTVLFAPDDLNLVSAPPASRRRYFDITICQLDPAYCRVLNEHRQILHNRNRLLLRIRERQANEDELEFWDNKLLTVSLSITKARRDMVGFYNNCLSGMYGKINDEGQELLLQYKPNLSYQDEKSFIAEFRAMLSSKRSLEVQRACSLVGPQRDDFGLQLDRKNLAAYGSRGEVRSAIIALKLAELDFFAKKLGERPILLLDDIFSELDQTRRQRLVETFNQQQTIVTTTDLSFVDKEAVVKGEVLNIE